MLPGQEVDRKFVNSVNPLVIPTPSVCEVTGWRRRRKIKGRRLFLFFIVCGCRLYDLLHDVIGIESSSIGTRLRWSLYFFDRSKTSCLDKKSTSINYKVIDGNCIINN